MKEKESVFGMVGQPHSTKGEPGVIVVNINDYLQIKVKPLSDESVEQYIARTFNESERSALSQRHLKVTGAPAGSKFQRGDVITQIDLLKENLRLLPSAKNDFDFLRAGLLDFGAWQEDLERRASERAGEAK